jgi:hypothetical protein
VGETRGDATAPVAPVTPPTEPAREGGADAEALGELRRKLEELQAQLSTISTRRDG